ncbi:MAG: penicillin-insensitive murein endopeptidase [Myxococcota bacterium]
MYHALVLLGLLAVATDAGAGTRATSFGGGACGKLSGGVALPCSGGNYESFSSLACTLGRNHLHPLVARTVTDAYALLQARHPDRRWQYGETGFRDGGRFWPHRTHRAGVSADFFVPVSRGVEPALLPVHPFNLLGYGVDVDARGVSGALRVDFRALADHLAALEEAGKVHGVEVRLVILDKPLQKLLLHEVPAARAFKKRFNKGTPWVRHDEHYHVEFTIPAAYRKPLKCR